MQNLSWRVFSQEQVKFLKSGIWVQFYNALNKDRFFDSLGTTTEKEFCVDTQAPIKAKIKKCERFGLLDAASA